MNARVCLAGAVACLLLVCTPFAGGKHEGGRRHGPHALLEELDLSAEQRAQLRTLLDEQRDSYRELKGRMRQVRTAMKTELARDRPDEEALAKTARESGKLAEEMVTRRIAYLLKVKKVLTAEQFDELLERHWVLKRPGHHKTHDSNERSETADSTESP
ncbi:MAG: periplasmic heavy metal sensor [Chitinivibrionales bacterium]|nr:periplasmic heavy metal sensor [Chitinivibrionales bacterium]